MVATSLLVRFYNALVEARRVAAEREIARHIHLMANFDKDSVFGFNPKH